MIAKKHARRRFTHYCEPFITQFRKELAEGYSWSYCCRTIVDSETKVKKYFTTYPELKILHENYINRKLDNK
jgi:hypothetical protein